jgi:iron complex outermembrane receptor protein
MRRVKQLNVENYLRDSNGTQIWGNASNASTDVSIGGRTFQIKASNFNVTTRDKQDLMLGLGAEGKLGGGWNYDAVLSSYIKLDDTYRSSDENPSDPNYDKSGSLTQFQDTGWQLLDLKFNKNNFMSNANLKFEGGYHYDHARIETIKWSVPDWENDERDEGTFSSSIGGQTDTHAVHTNVGWNFRPKWDLQVGGRLEAWRSFNGFEHESVNEIGGHDHVNEQAFSPKLSLGFKPRPDWNFQFSLARATRFAIPEEMFSNIDDYDDSNISNPGLKPEVGNHVTFMAAHYKPKATTKLNLFFDYINDTIYNDSSDGVSTFVNIDLVRTMGAELVLKRKDFLIRKHDFSFNTAFTDAEILFHGGTPTAHGKDLPRVPDWRVKFQSVYHFLEHWDGMIAARWQDRMWGRIQNDDPLDGSGGHSEYLFLDIKTNYESKNFISSFGITNLTDETAWTGPHQYPNRTYIFDVKWKI